MTNMTNKTVMFVRRINNHFYEFLQAPRKFGDKGVHVKADICLTHVGDKDMTNK